MGCRHHCGGQGLWHSQLHMMTWCVSALAAHSELLTWRRSNAGMPGADALLGSSRRLGPSSSTAACVASWKGSTQPVQLTGALDAKVQMLRFGARCVGLLRYIPVSRATAGRLLAITTATSATPASCLKWLIACLASTIISALLLLSG